jgi:hypothetical protein
MTHNPYQPPADESREIQIYKGQSHLSSLVVLNTRRVLDMVWAVSSVIIYFELKSPIWVAFAVVSLCGFLADIFMSLLTDTE